MSRRSARGRPRSAGRHGSATGDRPRSWVARIARSTQVSRPEEPPRLRDPPETQKSRRRPIFPKGCPLSIFGAGELNFRVRDGNGCGLSARVTGIFASGMFRQRHVARSRGSHGRRESISSISSSRQLDRSRSPATDPWSVAEEVKPSTVSTAQLHPSPDFHMRPIKQVVSLRSYPVNPVGNLISRRASHLDAFSAYPNRT